MLGRPVARTLALGALGGAVFVGCSLDWTVRLDAPANSSTDAAGEVGSTDGTSPDDATDAGSVGDGADGSTAACAVLVAEVASSLKLARECTLGSATDCKQTVTNECNCDVVVRLPGSEQATRYQNAVNALLDAGCPTGCSGGLCPSTSSRACLQQGASVACYP
jgi:hypothetical protein